MRIMRANESYSIAPIISIVPIVLIVPIVPIVLIIQTKKGGRAEARPPYFEIIVLIAKA